MSRRAAARLSLTNYLASEMSVAAKKPLPPALKALQPVLDTLPLEEDSEDETEAANIKDFTVRVVFVWWRAKANPGQLEAKVFYPKGEIQRESYRTKDGKVRVRLPGCRPASDELTFTECTPSPLESL